MDTPITKRINISGLTPSITLDDLSKRLGSFGKVESVDGLGTLNAIGVPRKFAFVTLHTTQGKLAKCMNVLSGSTWKGAKLKLGEAKPDYIERLAAEREAQAQTESEPPRKRRRLPRGIDGTHASDMSLVTPDIAKSKSGWKVTEMGRVLNKVRMRPERPLPPTLEEQAKMKKRKTKIIASDAGKKPTKETKEREDGKEKKRKRKDPIVRARRVTIDVTEWDSTQLKGMFLGSQGVSTGPRVEAALAPFEEDNDDDETSEEESEVEDEAEPELETHDAEEGIPTPTTSAPKPKTPPPTHLGNSDPNSMDIALETSKTLDLLSSIFVGKDDWVGRESVGSDVDEEELLKHDQVSKSPGDVEFELVPREREENGVKLGENQAEDDADEGDDEKGKEEKQEEDKPEARTTTSLKDLFAPREEEAGFSLLGHLDIDLELDEELEFPTAEAAPAISIQTYSSVPTAAPTTASSSTIYINPREHLFFPSSDSKHRGALDLIQEKGWLWSDRTVAFYRTESEDEIRAKWEEKKQELTKDWKKRAREAVKMVSRRGGRERGAVPGGINADGEL